MKKRINRLIILVIITCIINILFDTFLLYENFKNRQTYKTIINEYIPREEDFQQFSEAIYETQSLTLVQILTTDANRSKECINRIKELDKEIRTKLTSFTAFSPNKEQQKLLRELYNTYDTYYSQQKFVTEIESEQSLALAHNYVNNIMDTSVKKMNTTLDKIKENMLKQIDYGREQFAKSQTYSTVLTISVSMFFTLLIITLFIMFRRFTKQLERNIDLEISKREKQIIHMQSKTIEGMAELVESRDGETGLHVRNTAFYAELLAKKLAEDSPYKKILTPEYISLIKRYAPLHDVGKIVISDAILLKPARLTQDEFELMKTHTVEGGLIIDSILSDIETPEHIEIAKNIAVYHHEKWDGTGYPHQISGQGIPLCARIMSVADVFDALISKRCYKDAFSLDEAYRIIKDATGTQFDPLIVDAFLSERKKIEAYLKRTMWDK